MSVTLAALREAIGLRRQWFQLAGRVDASVHLSWSAMISGTAISIGRRTAVGPGAVLHASSSAGDRLAIGDDCRINAGARLYAWGGHVTLGDRVSVNTQTVLYGTGGITIGNGVRIAAQSCIIASQHGFEDPDVPIVEQGYTARGIAIEDDVWIGAGVCVLDGVRIGRGAVVGAGAVVTRNVEPFEVVAGVPARRLSIRGAGA
jgi:acetyltransferase-like isoleucine patch superfamily enzyme